jgi:hypothetical protein
METEINFKTNFQVKETKKKMLSLEEEIVVGDEEVAGQGE